MKTVKNNQDIRRVSDKTALELVESKKWAYCPKSEFKKKEK